MWLSFSMNSITVKMWCVDVYRSIQSCFWKEEANATELPLLQSYRSRNRSLTDLSSSPSVPYHAILYRAIPYHFISFHLYIYSFCCCCCCSGCLLMLLLLAYSTQLFACFAADVHLVRRSSVQLSLLQFFSHVYSTLRHCSCPSFWNLSNQKWCWCLLT